MLEPVQRQSLADAVFEQLRDRIVADEMAPGAPLPSERELAQLLGVNRQAVREGLKRLEQARLVRIHQGGATRVLPWRDEAGLGLLTALIFRPGGEIDVVAARSVVEMRSALAPELARLAARRGADADVTALRGHVAAIASHAGDLGAQQAHAMAFWGALAAASGNVAYRLALNTLRASYAQFDQLLTAVLADELADPAPYAGIVDAVEARDEAGAASRAAALIARGEAAIGAVLHALAGGGAA